MNSYHFLAFSLGAVSGVLAVMSFDFLKKWFDDLDKPDQTLSKVEPGYFLVEPQVDLFEKIKPKASKKRKGYLRPKKYNKELSALKNMGYGSMELASAHIGIRSQGLLGKKLKGKVGFKRSELLKLRDFLGV